ncbi:MAG TPA: hypothetical protein VK306_12815 [Acidimicrobiales bacterium]|nr:hypothetical protein [Acidimicrobiales bacterium]
MLKRLGAAGHVRRVRDRADQRRVLVELTERGRSLRGELASVPLALCARPRVTPVEAEALRARLTDLTAELVPLATTGARPHAGATAAALPADQGPGGLRSGRGARVTVSTGRPGASLNYSFGAG